MSMVRWGSLGCGDVCERKAGPALQGVEHSSLVCVMRRDLGKARDFAERHRVPHAVGRVEDLVNRDDVDAVFVATPNGTHEEMVLAAASAGKHVLCEKDMARDTAGADAMNRVCSAAGVSLGVAFYRRGYPSIRLVRDWIREGKIGVPLRLWLNDEYPLSHRVDLVQYLLGHSRNAWLTHESLPPGSHAAIGDVLHLETEGGAEAILNVGWAEAGVPETGWVEGTEGRIDVLDLKGGRLRRGWKGGSEEVTVPGLPATHWGIVENFVRHLRAGERLLCDGEEGRKSQILLDLVETLTPGDAPVPVVY